MYIDLENSNLSVFRENEQLKARVLKYMEEIVAQEKDRKGRVKRGGGEKRTLSERAMIRKQRSQTGRVNSRRRDGKAYVCV